MASVSFNHNFKRSDLAAAATAALPTLVDSTGATASTTAIANLANGSTYATDHPTIEANFATLTAKVNAILVVLRAHGLIDS